MAAQGHARAPIDGKLRSIEWRVRRIYPRSTGKTRQHRTQLDLRAVQPPEDYVNGLRLHNLGCSQVFVPLSGRGSEIVTRREYFPQTARTAVCQRSRWITGIAVQCWERHGWRGRLPQVDWFGAIARACSATRSACLRICYSSTGFSCGSALASRVSPWGLAHYSFHPGLLATLGIQAVQTAVRFGCNAHLRSILRLRCASPILMWKLDQFHGALSRCIPIPSRTPSMGQDRARLPLPHPLSPSTSAGSARYSRAPAMHRKTSSTKP